MVKYDNQMNSAELGGLNVVENNMFFAICREMRDKGDQLIVFSFNELREISNYKTRGDRFIKDLEGLYKKLSSITYTKRSSSEIDIFSLFNRFRIDIDKSIVEVTINPQFMFVLNNLKNEFTQFELAEFLSLDSSYSKTIFRLLKQFKSTGYFVIDKEQFLSIVGAPKSYKTQSKIDQKILNPAIKELSKYFKDLKLGKVKAKNKNKIQSYIFSFEPQSSSAIVGSEHVPKIPMHNWLEGE